jgi:hypothetical protein
LPSTTRSSGLGFGGFSGDAPSREVLRPVAFEELLFRGEDADLAVAKGLSRLRRGSPHKVADRDPDGIVGNSHQEASMLKASLYHNLLTQHN